MPATFTDRLEMQASNSVSPNTNTNECTQKNYRTNQNQVSSPITSSAAVCHTDPKTFTSSAICD